MFAANSYRSTAFVAACLLMVAAVAAGQTSSSKDSRPMGPLVTSTSPAAQLPGPETEGRTIGDFKVQQYVDFGGRITSVNGSQAMYNTLVNVQAGPRIFEQSLTMQSINHQDAFDTLTLVSYGWGGDPQEGLRMRVNKYRWYTFTGSYQYMQNYFDYNLFANPLNPPTFNPFLPVNFSPHAYYNRQKLYNFGIVALPLRRISIRFDYSRSSFTGPSFSSDHQGTEALTNQNTDSILNGYRFGADFKVTKKTVLSYTQLLQWYTGQTGYTLSPYNSFGLRTGQSVSFGLPWGNGSPCNAPLNNGIANPVCNGFFSYSDTQNTNTFIPTEQINLKSTSLKWLDFNGQYQYSGASMNSPNVEIFNGLITRSAVRGSNSTGTNSKANWVSRSADVSATVKITDKLRLVEIFRFRNWQSYGSNLTLGNNYFAAASAGSASLLNPISTFPPTILGHTSSSPQDVVNELNANLDGQETKQNDFQVQYDVSRNFGGHAGFQWTGINMQPGTSSTVALGDIYYPNNPNRGNCAGLPLNPNGSCTFVGIIAPWGNPTVPINRYSWVAGLWYQKGGLHAHVDANFGSANNYAYRIDPRTGQNITGSVMYAPLPWISAGADFVYQRATNYSNGSQINYNQHNYHSAFSTTITPAKLFAFDMAYSFDAIQQDIVECYPGPYPVNSPQCFDGSGYTQTYAFYNAHTQYGFLDVLLKPMPRLNIRAGYSFVINSGNTTQFDLYQPLGPLTSRYQLPMAAVDYTFYKNIAFRAGWNYQNYNEPNSFVGPTAPRAFHANQTTLAIRYAF